MRRVHGCILSVLLVLLGCTTAQPIPDEALLKTWLGKPKDELIAVLGPPTSEQPSETGMTILTWQSAQRHPGGFGRMGMAASYYSFCIREFEIDPTGTVRGATQRGCH
jgi:hypothetical protein